MQHSVSPTLLPPYQIIAGVEGSRTGLLSGTALLCGDERWHDDLRRGVAAAVAVRDGGVTFEKEVGYSLSYF